MSDRQYIRKEEKHFRGRRNSYVFKTEEHSAFLEDGNIVTRLKSEQPVAKGILPHQQKDIIGECQNCYQFITEKMFTTCEMCRRVYCLPCTIRNNQIILCPACSISYNQHRIKLMIRKFFISPFLEWVK